LVLVIVLGAAGFVIGLGVALYYKYKGNRQEQEERRKAFARFMSRAAPDPLGEGGGELGGDVTADD
jgi:hypothetical protein